MTDGFDVMAAGPVPAGVVPAAFADTRADIVRVLRSWSAPTPRLDGVRHDMLEQAAAHPGCAWREGGPAHFTASIVILDAALTRVALTLHGKAKRWFQFGGHLEETDTSIRGAAIREGREESGLGAFRTLDDLVHVDIHNLPGSFGRCRTHLDLRFAAVCGPDAKLATSAESDDVRWWPLDALPADTESTMREAIDLAVVAAQKSRPVA